MIDLYALTSPNVRKVYVMLEELELPYQEHFVDVWKGDNYDPEFRKLNPNGKIPVIVDHDGPGGAPYTVFESGAILMYLADKTGRFLPKDTVKGFPPGPSRSMITGILPFGLSLRNSGS